MIKLLDVSCAPALTHGTTAAEQLIGAYHNTGNLLFADALRRHLPSARRVHQWNDFESDCETAILSMANFINPHSDVSEAVAYWRRSPAERIVLAGCGAQALHESEWFDLRPDTRTFLEIVSERSRSIGVRGHYTAELLRRHGFANTRIIGCPAFFVFGAELPSVRSEQSIRRVAIATTPSGDRRDQVRSLFAFGQRWDAWYVLQSEELLTGLFDPAVNLSQDENFRFFSNFYCPDRINVTDFASWLKHRAVMFFEVSSWVEHFRSVDLFIGSRIHGALSAIRGGCPALVLVQDTRTRELCHWFGLPFIELSDFDPDASPNDYLRLARYGRFADLYPLRLATYRSFLQENGLSPAGLGDSACLENPPLIQDLTPDLDRLPIEEATRLRITVQADHDDRLLRRTPEPVAAREPPLSDSPLIVRLQDSTATPDDLPPAAAPVADEVALRADVMAKLRNLQASIGTYTQVTGLAPDFILGVGIPAAGIPVEKLARCRVMSDRGELIREMPRHGFAAEVGTQTGTFAHYILQCLPALRLVTIDIDYTRFQFDRLQPFIDSGQLTTIQGSSWEKLAEYPADYFSLIYVDASHHFENVRRDLEVARSRVEVGGYIICNDYTVWSPFEAHPYGVLHAVNEFLNREDFEVTHFAFHPFGYHDIAMRRRS